MSHAAPTSNSVTVESSGEATCTQLICYSKDVTPSWSLQLVSTKVLSRANDFSRETSQTLLFPCYYHHLRDVITWVSAGRPRGPLFHLEFGEVWTYCWPQSVSCHIMRLGACDYCSSANYLSSWGNTWHRLWRGREEASDKGATFATAGRSGRLQVITFSLLFHVWFRSLVLIWTHVRAGRRQRASPLTSAWHPNGMRDTHPAPGHPPPRSRHALTSFQPFPVS